MNTKPIISKYEHDRELIAQKYKYKKELIKQKYYYKKELSAIKNKYESIIRQNHEDMKYMAMELDAYKESMDDINNILSNN